MTSSSIQAQWYADLDKLAVRAGIKTPRLRIVKSDMSSLGWFWARRHNAWCRGATISVTDDLLDLEPDVRRYVLAHELGHAAQHHSIWMSASAVNFLAMLIPVCLYHGLRHITMSVSLLAASFTAMCIVLLFTEVQADKLAQRLLGRNAVIRGNEEMGNLAGTVRTIERRIKLTVLRRR